MKSVLSKIKYLFIFNRTYLSKFGIYQFFYILYSVYHKFICVYYSTGNSLICPCCNFAGIYFVNNISCPKCWSPERELLLALLEKKLKQYYEATILEVAPKKATGFLFNTKYKNYISIDLDSSHAMFQMDLTDLKFEDNKFSLIICYHVLEHVKNDTKAIEEIYRVIKPNFARSNRKRSLYINNFFNSDNL